MIPIETKLKAIFPDQPHLVDRWLSSPNKAFDMMSPNELVDKYGAEGANMIHSYLDAYMNDWR